LLAYKIPEAGIKLVRFPGRITGSHKTGKQRGMEVKAPRDIDIFLATC